MKMTLGRKIAYGVIIIVMTPWMIGKWFFVDVLNIKHEQKELFQKPSRG